MPRAAARPALGPPQRQRRPCVRSRAAMPSTRRSACASAARPEPRRAIITACMPFAYGDQHGEEGHTVLPPSPHACSRRPHRIGMRRSSVISAARAAVPVRANAGTDPGTQHGFIHRPAAGRSLPPLEALLHHPSCIEQELFKAQPVAARPRASASSGKVGLANGGDHISRSYSWRNEAGKRPSGGATILQPPGFIHCAACAQPALRQGIDPEQPAPCAPDPCPRFPCATESQATEVLLHTPREHHAAAPRQLPEPDRAG